MLSSLLYVVVKRQGLTLVNARLVENSSHENFCTEFEEWKGTEIEQLRLLN